MVKYIKENWFVAVVAVFFLVISVYFAYDQNKDKLPGKKSNGQDVVYTVADKTVTADEYYDTLYKDYGDTQLFIAWEKALLDQAVEYTDEMKSKVQSTHDYYVSMYQQYYGISQDYIDSYYASETGFDSFFDYLLYSDKQSKLNASYVLDNLDQYYTDAIRIQLRPRIISYVVISVKDIDNPTEEELSKINEAKTAWASGEYNSATFADFAKKYSQDSNQSNGGRWGYIDTTTDGVDTTFRDAACALSKAGDVSDWIESKDFGYFLIKVDSTDLEDLKQEEEFATSLMKLTDDDDLQAKILWNKSEELKTQFSSDEVKTMIRKLLGLEKEVQ